MKVSKGDRYKYKTKKWLEQNGYVAFLSETYRRFVDKKTGKVVIRKYDIFGADVIAMNGEEIVFAQSKLGRKNIADGIKGFLKYDFPDCVQLWVVVWEKYAREPEIIDVKEILEKGGDA